MWSNISCIYDTLCLTMPHCDVCGIFFIMFEIFVFMKNCFWFTFMLAELTFRLWCMVGNILDRFRVFDVRDWFKYLFSWTWKIELEGFIQSRASQLFQIAWFILCFVMTFKDSWWSSLITRFVCLNSELFWTLFFKHKSSPTVKFWLSCIWCYPQDDSF